MDSRPTTKLFWHFGNAAANRYASGRQLLESVALKSLALYRTADSAVQNDTGNKIWRHPNTDSRLYTLETLRQEDLGPETAYKATSTGSFQI